MRLTDRLSLPQRTVIVVALAAACAAVGAYVTARSDVVVGWYAYAPLTTPGPGRGGLPDWGRLLIWLGLAAAWALVSVWILRPARPARPAAPPA